jgi:hypothetical protein
MVWRHLSGYEAFMTATCRWHAGSCARRSDTPTRFGCILNSCGPAQLEWGRRLCRPGPRPRAAIPQPFACE